MCGVENGMHPFVRQGRLANRPNVFVMNEEDGVLGPFPRVRIGEGICFLNIR
jgi:hypothetical protein